MPKSRVEGLSDGVIAVAITLLVFNLHVPDPGSRGSLAANLGREWPNFVAYAVSFATIGIIWVNHHAMLRRLVRVDHVILMLNLGLLMAIAVLPFSTALMAQYLRAARGAHLAAVVYGASLLLMALAFFSMQRHVMLAKAHLLHEHIERAQRMAVVRRNSVGLIPYAVATASGAISPYLTIAICALVAAFYALPGTTAADGEARERVVRGAEDEG